MVLIDPVLLPEALGGARRGKEGEGAHGQAHFQGEIAKFLSALSGTGINL